MLTAIGQLDSATSLGLAGGDRSTPTSTGNGLLDEEEPRAESIQDDPNTDTPLDESGMPTG